MEYSTYRALLGSNPSPERRREIVREFYLDMENADKSVDPFGYNLRKVEVLASHMWEIFTVIKTECLHRWDLFQGMEVGISRLDELLPAAGARCDDHFNALWGEFRGCINHARDWSGSELDATNIATVLFATAGMLRAIGERGQLSESTGLAYGYSICLRSLQFPIPDDCKVDEAVRILVRNFAWLREKAFSKKPTPWRRVRNWLRRFVRSRPGNISTLPTSP